MLAEAVAQAKAGQAKGQGEAAVEEQESWTPQIQLGLPVLIPDEYVPDLPVRLGLYRRLSELVSEEAIDAFAAELSDRFGPLPEPVKNLLDVLVIKQDCLKAHIAKFDAGPKGAILSFHKNTVPYVDKLMAFIQSQLGQVKIRPDQKLVYLRSWDNVDVRLAESKVLIKKLADMAG
jgi:transcription-repair coupling factor (superfamily II helicase)